MRSRFSRFRFLVSATEIQKCQESLLIKNLSKYRKINPRNCEGIYRLCNCPSLVCIPETNLGRNVRKPFTEQAKLWSWAHSECKRALCSPLTDWSPTVLRRSFCWEDQTRQCIRAWQPSLHSFGGLINTLPLLGSRPPLHWRKEPHNCF